MNITSIDKNMRRAYPKQSIEKADENTGKLIQDVIKRLLHIYPDAKTTLDYTNPLELLVATILSAQCTDERINRITKDLFKKYRSTNDYAKKSLKELEHDIKPSGFYKNKAKNIKNTCQKIINDFDGCVPKTMGELISLPGVARKTGNVVLGNAFGIPEGIAVDTHVHRVSNRLGLSNSKNPVKVEVELMANVPRNLWINFSHMMILHGRTTCKALRPQCSTCSLESLCPKIGVTKEP